MGESKNMAEMVEEKLNLIRRYLLQSSKGLQAKEKKLQEVQESMRKSSEKLSMIRETMQDKKKVSHFLLEKGLKEVETQRKIMGLIQENVMIRLEKLIEKERLIEGLFEKVELEVEEFETIKKLVDDCFVEIQFEQRQVDDNVRELELIKNQAENRGNGIDSEKGEIQMSEKSFRLKKEKLVAKENELGAREKILGLKLEEIVAKEKELEAREKNLNLMKEPDSKERELDSVRKSTEQGLKKSDSINTVPLAEEQRGQKSRKREGTHKNETLKSSKRCHFGVEGIFNCAADDNDAEQIAADDVNESGAAASGCDDFKESSSDTTGDLKDGIQVLPELAANNGPDSNALQIVSPGSRYISDSNPIDYSKLLFNDFDDDEKLKILEAGQTWSTYDKKDDLPRSYFLVIKVLKSRLAGIAKLQVVWLQPIPNYLAWKELKYSKLRLCNKTWKEWLDAGLPVGCGVFKRGKEQTLLLSLDRLCDQVSCKNNCSSYLIHPSKGDTWALYKDWDIVRWACDPQNHRHCKYEIVEVLERCSMGTRVAYLNKLEGFVSLFQRRSQRERDSFLIEDKELFRFSHKVPSFKMTGNKIQGVQEGSFELDPKDLPKGFW